MSSLRMSFAVVATAGLLAGCGFNPLGAEMPKPVTVAGYLHETTTGSISANGEPLTAGEYLVASVSYTNEKCHEFFNNLEKLKQDSAFLDSLLTSVVATGRSIPGTGRNRRDGRYHKRHHRRRSRR